MEINMEAAPGLDDMGFRQRRETRFEGAETPSRIKIQDGEARNGAGDDRQGWKSIVHEPAAKLRQRRSGLLVGAPGDSSDFGTVSGGIP